MTLPQHDDNDELALFRDMVVRFIEQEVTPNFDQWEEAHLMPREFWRTMGEAGLLLVDMPEQYGTAGASIDVCLMIQELFCRHGYIALSSGYGIHSSIVAPYINNIATEEQKSQWLPSMATGEVVSAIAMTEPGAGSDLAGMRTRAVRDGDDYIINGSKTFITNGIHADMVIVCAKTDPSAGSKGISLFMVDTSLQGFSRGKKIEKMGQHCSDTAELFFEDLRVPANALLGEEGKGFVYLMEELPRERLGCSVQAIGLGQCALNMAADYVKDRKAFGQSISQFQNTRFKLANCKTEIELCLALYEKYLGKFKRQQMTPEHASIIKLAATEMSLKVIDECLQLFGGYGYTDEYPISRLYRDARVQTIYAGTSEIMKEVIARGVVGR
jgi:acyl-CoA dehydrogenase